MKPGEKPLKITAYLVPPRDMQKYLLYVLKFVQLVHRRDRHGPEKYYECKTSPCRAAMQFATHGELYNFVARRKS